MPTMHARLCRTILRNARKAGKFYEYDDESSLDEPIMFFFQESVEGLVLFIVYRTLPCVFNGCTFCRLPGTSTLREVNFRHVMNQTRYVMTHPDVVPRLDEIQKLIISNQGSILDQRTFDQLALMDLIAQGEYNFPNMASMCLETRICYVEDEEIVLLGHAMAGGDTVTVLEFGIGVEAYNDSIRNSRLGKGMHLREKPNSLERLAERLSLLCEDMLRFRIKCYFLQKPHESMTDEEAVQDVKDMIDFMSGLVAKHAIRMNLHLNPTFAAKETKLETEFKAGRFTPPRLSDVARAVLYAEDKGVSVFVGLDDEGLACEGGSFLQPGNERMVAALDQFNRTQDFDELRARLDAYLGDPHYNHETDLIEVPTA